MTESPEARRSRILKERLLDFPECPECQVFEGLPCRDPDTGRVRGRHRTRVLVANGDLIMIRREDAKEARLMTEVRELVRIILQRRRIRLESPPPQPTYHPREPRDNPPAYQPRYRRAR